MTREIALPGAEFRIAQLKRDVEFWKEAKSTADVYSRKLRNALAAIIYLTTHEAETSELAYGRRSGTEATGATMTREECKRNVLQRAFHGVRAGLETREAVESLDRLLEKHYPARKPAYEGHVPADYNFSVRDVLELERKMRRGEGR